MEIVSTAVYVGPNIYAKQPLIRLTVDLHRRAKRPVSAYADALIEPLFRELPGLATATSELGTPLPERLKAPDCHLGELMAQVAIALQNRGGAPAEVAMTRPAAHEDEVEVLYGYESEEIGLEAGEVARAIILELIAPDDDDEAPFDIAEAIADFDHFASRRSLGPSALALVRAAEARDIPWVRLNDASLIQVGQGKYQKRIEAALTSQTSHTAVEIASDKELCSRLLFDLGLPVPKQFHVRDAEDAVDAANAIGYPVVVKPVDGNHGRGVSVNLTRDGDVADAFEIAINEGSGVIVESMILGEDHRLMVIGGKLVAAARSAPRRSPLSSPLRCATSPGCASTTPA
jgi:cyanophycin synthetase